MFFIETIDEISPINQIGDVLILNIVKCNDFLQSSEYLRAKPIAPTRFLGFVPLNAKNTKGEASREAVSPRRATGRLISHKHR